MIQANYSRHLIIMARRPVIGQVKTRLARDIGAVRATGFYRHLLANTLARLKDAPQWNTWLAVSPDEAVHDRSWPDGIDVISQGSGDLGARMSRLMLRMPPGPVIIIGSDIPGVHARDIQSGFGALNTADVVFGPAPDGGYWLVGVAVRRHVSLVFANVAWSSANTLRDSLSNVQALKVTLLDEKNDVDRGADLKSANGSGRLILSAV